MDARSRRSNLLVELRVSERRAVLAFTSVVASRAGGLDVMGSNCASKRRRRSPGGLAGNGSNWAAASLTDLSSLLALHQDRWRATEADRVGGGSATAVGSHDRGDRLKIRASLAVD